MTIDTFLQMAEKFEIQVYEERKIPRNLQKEHVCYVGTPQKHPFFSDRLILFSNSFSTNTSYYEFRFDDIFCVEKLPSIVDPGGEVVSMARIWVRKKSIGIHCIPFVVEDTTDFNK